MDRLRSRVLLSLLLGALLLVGMALYADVQKLGEGMRAFSWSLLPAVLGLVVGNYAFRVAKWHLYLARLGIRIPLLDSALIFLSGLLLTVTPGKLGELFKSALLKQRHGVPVTTSAPIVFAERLTDFIALLLLSLAGVAASGHGVVVVLSTALAMLGVVVYLSSRRLSLGTIRLLARLPLVGSLASKMEELYESMYTLVRPGILLWTTVLSVAGWFLECVAFWVVLGGFPGVSASLGEATFIYAFASMFGALTMLPGGLFATEGSMVGLLQEVFRIIPHRAIASAATLLIRFCTLWFAVLIGAVAYALLRLRYSASQPPR